MMSCEDDFPFLSTSQTLTLAPLTPILPLYDSSYSNIHFPPISSFPPPSIPSSDLPINSNLIPPYTSVPLRRSTHTKQPPTWHNDYEMSSSDNHLTSSTSLSTGTR